MNKALFSMVMGALFLLSAVTVKAENKVIAAGKLVKMDYTLTVDGKVVDTSAGKQPLQYIQGQHQIIPGLERQLEGMKVGDQKKIIVLAVEGYGMPNKNFIVEAPKTNLAKGIVLEKGIVLQTQTQDGQVHAGKVVEIKDKTMMIDFNHPLAGKDLVFDVKIVDVGNAPTAAAEMPKK
ncbi:MAG: peptidylprolyl isomerase [Candidatus Omnitrophica bacterium]|nr:peptidylprolyl isomerase [Candidatus Omnitrophota bacterium]